MNCPACCREMTVLEVGGIEVDACVGGCGGLWFDAFELRQLDEPEENYGEALVDIQRDESVHVDLQIKRRCPRCETVNRWAMIRLDGEEWVAVTGRKAEAELS